MTEHPFRLLVPIAFALLGTVSACGDDVAPAATPAFGPAPAGSAAAQAAGPAAAAAVPPRRDFPESEFVETERSRDPFRSYLGRFVSEAPGRMVSQRQVILGEFAVDELKLVGIVTRITPARAMLVDPTGKGHVVHRGDFVGRADVVQITGQSATTYQLNWRLDRIRDSDVVLVREDPNNPDVPAATKVISLRPESANDKPSGT